MSDKRIYTWMIMGGIYVKHDAVPTGCTQVKPDQIQPGDLFIVSRDTSGSDTPGPCNKMFVCVRKTYCSETGKLKYLRYVMTSHQRAYSFHVLHQRKVKYWLVQRLA